MSEVLLTLPEYMSAVQVGLARFLLSESRGHNHASTYERSWLKRMEEEAVGACAERAYCKFRNRHWDASFNTFHEKADAGEKVEIRGTVRDDGCLIIRENDADDRWYVLVTGQPPVMKIRGFLLGKDAKVDQWLRNPDGHRPCWMIPQRVLRRFA